MPGLVVTLLRGGVPVREVWTSAEGDDRALRVLAAAVDEARQANGGSMRNLRHVFELHGFGVYISTERWQPVSVERLLSSLERVLTARSLAKLL